MIYKGEIDHQYNSADNDNKVSSGDVSRNIGSIKSTRIGICNNEDFKILMFNVSMIVN